MHIKDIETRTGLSRANIRYYEQEGLVHPVRARNGYRDYSQEDLDTLLRVRLDWLYGEEEGGRRVQDPRGKWDASAMDRHAIDAFLALDERHRKLVRELVAALAAVPRG